MSTVRRLASLLRPQTISIRCARDTSLPGWRKKNTATSNSRGVSSTAEPLRVISRRVTSMRMGPAPSTSATVALRPASTSALMRASSSRSRGWLDDEIVGARLECLHDVGLGIAVGQEQHRRVRHGLAADGAQHVVAGQVRHAPSRARPRHSSRWARCWEQRPGRARTGARDARHARAATAAGRPGRDRPPATQSS